MGKIQISFWFKENSNPFCFQENLKHFKWKRSLLGLKNQKALYKQTTALSLINIYYNRWYMLWIRMTLDVASSESSRSYHSTVFIMLYIYGWNIIRSIPNSDMFIMFRRNVKDRKGPKNRDLLEFSRNRRTISHYNLKRSFIKNWKISAESKELKSSL